MSGFEVKNLGFTIAGRQLLNQVNLHLVPAQVTAIIGTNGAGKSTLLHHLTGEVSPTVGEVVFQGKPLSAWSIEALAQKRAVLAQSVNLNFPLSVVEVIELGLEVVGGDAAFRQQRLAALLQWFDLQDLQHQNYLTLSGGEQQRVQLARVFAQLHPERLAESWLLLDEWSEGLDLRHQKQVGQLLRQHAEAGVGVLMILHDLNLVSQWADSVVGLKQGEVVFHAPIEAALQAERLSELFGVEIVVMQQTGRRCIQVK